MLPHVSPHLGCPASDRESPCSTGLPGHAAGTVASSSGNQLTMQLAFGLSSGVFSDSPSLLGAILRPVRPVKADRTGRLTDRPQEGRRDVDKQLYGLIIIMIIS
jgi:hypothetical protein